MRKAVCLYYLYFNLISIKTNNLSNPNQPPCGLRVGPPRLTDANSFRLLPTQMFKRQADVNKVQANLESIHQFDVRQPLVNLYYAQKAEPGSSLLAVVERP